MGAEQLVGRQRQEVATDRLDVQRHVRRRLDRIDEDQRVAGGPHRGDDRGEVVQGAERVARATHRDEARPLRQEGRQLVEPQPPGLGREVQPADRHAAVGRHRQPGGDVGVVVETADDEFVAGRPVARQGTRNGQRQRRHVRAERDFLPPRVQQIRGGPMRLRGDRIDRDRHRERPAGVRRPADEMRRYRLDRVRAYLGAAGRVEVDPAPAIVLGVESGKAGAHGIDGESHAAVLHRSRAFVSA